MQDGLDRDPTERIDCDATMPLAVTPFAARFRVDFLADSRQAQHEVRIAPGRPLVIESMTVLLPGGPTFAPRGRVLLVIHTIAYAKEAVHCFRFAFPSTEETRTDPKIFKKTRILVDAGASVQFAFIREAVEDARSVVFSALGQLVVRP
jgi:hypothetical protein